MKTKDKYMHKTCHRLYNPSCSNITPLLPGPHKGEKKTLSIFLFNHVLNESHGIFKFLISDNKHTGL